MKSSSICFCLVQATSAPIYDIMNSLLYVWMSYFVTIFRSIIPKTNALIFRLSFILCTCPNSFNSINYNSWLAKRELCFARVAVYYSAVLFCHHLKLMSLLIIIALLDVM